MAVYYSKARKSWFIRYPWKRRLCYCYTDPETGRAFSCRAAAKRYEPVFVSSLVGSASPVAKAVLCDELFSPFILSLSETLKESTVYGFKVFFRRYVAPAFRGVGVSELDNTFLDRFNLRLNKCGNRSMGRAVSVGRHWARFLRKYNPSLDPERVFGFKRDSVRPRKYSFYTLGQFQTFMSAVKAPRDRLLFGLLFYYGLRISEALALKWSDFSDGKLSVSRILSAKSGEGRQVFTSPKTACSVRTLPVIGQVRELMGACKGGKGYLFPSKKRGASVMGQSQAHRLNLGYAKKAGLPAIKLHEFRHSCATYLLSSGVSPRYVSRWLGHSSEETTLRYYSHLLPDEETVVSDFWGRVGDGSSKRKT